jgi:hypothetical protein
MINTKKFRRHSCIVAVFYLVMMPFTSIADVYNLTVDKVIIDTGKFKKQGIGYNGASPGPVLRME